MERQCTFARFSFSEDPFYSPKPGGGPPRGFNRIRRSVWEPVFYFKVIKGQLETPNGKKSGKRGNNTAASTVATDLASITVNMPTNSTYVSLTVPAGWAISGSPAVGQATAVTVTNNAAFTGVSTSGTFTLTAKINSSATGTVSET